MAASNVGLSGMAKWGMVLDVLKPESKKNYIEKVLNYEQWCLTKEKQPINCESIYYYILDVHGSGQYNGNFT